MTRWVRPFDWESSSANLQTIADTIEAERREAERQASFMVGNSPHYEIGPTVWLVPGGKQHKVTGMALDESGPASQWLYQLDGLDLWIPEFLLDQVSARTMQATNAPPVAPSPDIRVEPERERSARRRNEFVSRVCSAINCSSLENGSDTPDYIIANFLADVLMAYDSALQQREKWYGRTIGVPGI